MLFSRVPVRTSLAAVGCACLLAACADHPTLPPVSASDRAWAAGDPYHIGPGDTLDVEVWKSPELSGKVPVQPDGRISLPLAPDVLVEGKTPTEVAEAVTKKLRAYVKDPVVSVTPIQFVSPVDRQVRVIGEVTQPRAILYSDHMTVLDVMIAAGGLTKFADGDRAVIVRNENGKQTTYTVHLDSLIRDADVKENVAVKPGDVVIVPERFF